MKVHRAWRFHPVVPIQTYLRRDSADGGSDRRYRHGGKVGKSVVACEDDDRPCFIRRSELIEPDLSARYSAGHTASGSHVRDSFPP
jgi:hypothetical protein